MTSGTGRGLVAGLCLVLSACGTPASSSPSVGAKESATVVLPTASPPPSATVTPFPLLPPTSMPTTLADSPWQQVGHRSAPDDPSDWLSVVVGLGDGTITGELRIGEPKGEGLGPAFAHGPLGGRVVAASMLSGTLTELTIIDVPTGQMAAVVSEPDILDATLDPTGDAALLGRGRW